MQEESKEGLEVQDLERELLIARIEETKAKTTLSISANIESKAKADLAVTEKMASRAKVHLAALVTFAGALHVIFGPEIVDMIRGVFIK